MKNMIEILLLTTVCVACIVSSGIGQKLSIGKSPEVQRAIQQVDELHSELAPSEWDATLPNHVGWWRCRNLNLNLRFAVYEVQEFPPGSGILVLNLGGSRIPLTDLSEGWEWSDPVLYWPKEIN